MKDFKSISNVSAIFDVPHIREEIIHYLKSSWVQSSEDNNGLSDDAWCAIKRALLSCPKETALFLKTLKESMQKVKECHLKTCGLFELGYHGIDKKEEKLEAEIHLFQRKFRLLHSPEKISLIFRDALDFCLSCIMEVECILRLPCTVRDFVSTESNEDVRAMYKDPASVEYLSINDVKFDELFYIILALSSDADPNVLASLFGRILVLCHEKEALSLHRAYLSLLASGKEFLHMFCEAERVFLDSMTEWNIYLWSRKQYSCLFNFFPCIINNILENNSHLLIEVFNMLLCEPMESLSFIVGEQEGKPHWLQNLWPVVLMNTWCNSAEKYGFIKLIHHSLLSVPATTDKLLRDSCLQLQNDITSAEWCISLSKQVNLPILLQLIRNHSPLYAANKSLSLSQLCQIDVIQFLHESCLQRDPSGKLALSSIATYKAFCILLSTFHAISAGIELDNLVFTLREQVKHAKNYRSISVQSNILFESCDTEKLAEFYRENIYKKIVDIQNNIFELEPLEYQVEVIENIFSLLFLRHDDICSDLIESSFDEENELSLCHDHDRLNDSAFCSTSVDNLSHQEKKINVSQRNLGLKSMDMFYSKELPRTGFLLNTLVTWDLLLLMKNVIEALENSIVVDSEECSSNSLQNRVSYLSRNITECLWRLQVIFSFDRKMGSLENFPLLLSVHSLTEASNTIYERDLAQVYATNKTTISRDYKEFCLINKRVASGDDPSIVSFLLASPSSLFAMALSGGHIDQAWHVVSSCDLPLEQLELKYAIKLRSVRPQLQSFDSNTTFLSESQSGEIVSRKVQNIGLLARHCSNQISPINLVNDLLIHFLPPVPQGFDHLLHTGESTTLFGYPQLLVLSDLALSSSVSENTSISLLDQVLERAKVKTSTDLSSVDCKFQFLSLIQKLSATCCAVAKDRTNKDSCLVDGSLSNYYKILYPENCTAVNLLLSADDLNEAKFMDCIKAWSCVLTSLLSSIRSYNGHALTETASTLANDAIQNLISTVSSNSGKVLPVFSRHNKTKVGAYLHTFYCYLQSLFILVKHQGSTKSKCYFEFLQERPVRILGKLIFEDGVDPHDLESMSIRMKLDLTKVIWDYCCPQITFTSSAQYSSVIDSSSKLFEDMLLQDFACTVDGNQIILNSGHVDDEYNGHIELLVTDLLNSLMDFVKEIIGSDTDASKKERVVLDYSSALKISESAEIRGILKETVKLTSVSIDTVPAGDDRVAFMFNLSNLMVFHSLLISALFESQGKSCCNLFSRTKSQHLLAMMKMGYLIADLGFISLYDMIFVGLRQSYHEALISDVKENVTSFEFHSIFLMQFDTNEDLRCKLHKYLPSIPRLSQFLLCQGYLCCPKLQTVYGDRLEEQMLIAAQEYLQAYLKFELTSDVDCSKKNSVKIYTSVCILDYISQCSLGWNEGINELISYCHTENVHALEAMKADQSASKYSDVIIEVLHCEKGMHFEYSDDTCLFSGSYSATGTSYQSDSCSLVKTNETIDSYLRDKCPLIGKIVSNITSKLGASNGTNSSDDKDKGFSLTDNLFSCDRYKNISALYGYNSTIAALSFHLSPLLVWKFIDDILFPCTPGTSASEEEKYYKILSTIEEIPEQLQLEYDLHLWFDYTCLYIGMIANIQSSPWLCLYKIRDPSIRHSAINYAYRRYPISEAVKLLQFAAGDAKQNLVLREIMQKKYEQLIIYEQVMDLPEFSTSTWQEVEHLSNSGEEFMKRLIDSQNYSLGMQWVLKHHYVHSVKEIVNKNLLLDCLDRGNPDFSAAERIIQSFSSEAKLNALDFLLNRIKVLSVRRFLIDSLLSCVLDLSDSEKETLETQGTFDLFSLWQEVMGIILLKDIGFLVSPSHVLTSLVEFPYLIIELWIMNLKLEAVEQAKYFLTPYLNMEKNISCMPNKYIHAVLMWKTFNTMLEYYAEKSLEMRGIQLERCMSPSIQESSENFVVPLNQPKKANWIPDSIVDTCPVCRITSFSFFSRKHHCRCCGRVVCEQCSKTKAQVAGYGNVHVRVCSDCFRQMHSQKTSKGDGRRISCAGESSEMSWYLYGNHEQDVLIREEFNFDYIPSVNIALALLVLHENSTDVAFCGLKLIYKLLSYIVPFITSPEPTVDYSFTLNMLKSLISYTKLKFNVINMYDGITLCEYYNQWIDLLTLFSRSNCIDLIPLSALNNMLEIAELRRLFCQGQGFALTRINSCLQKEYNLMKGMREALIKRQQWLLALDISTKIGLDVSGVWAAWGMASLKAGSFCKAREYFSRVLERPSDKARQCKSSLLPEILKFLESNPFRVDKDIVEKSKNILEKKTFFKYSKLPEPSEALVVNHSLINLRSIASGSLSSKYIVKTYEQLQLIENNITLEPLFINECKYYLKLYGNHAMILQFYVRLNLLNDCVAYLYEESVDVNIAATEVFLPILRCRKLRDLFSSIQALKNEWVPNFLFEICKWLEKQNYFSCLLEVQKLLGDNARAALTLLKMYASTSDTYNGLLQHAHFLEEAKHYFNLHLQENKPCSPFVEKKLPLLMSDFHTKQYLNAIELQESVTKYLGNIEDQNHLSSLYQSILATGKVSMVSRLPTLFGSKCEKLVVAVGLLCANEKVNHSIELVCKIVERMGISVEKLLSVSVEVLAKYNRVNCIVDLVSHIQSWGLLSSRTVDAVVRETMRLIGDKKDAVDVELLVRLVSDEKEKVYALIDSGRLRTAYLLAVKLGQMDLVKAVQEAAEHRRQVLVVKLCSKWLEGQDVL